MSLSAADVKAALKEAREALKNKQFDAAAKHCQAILADDPNHYMALVLMGASLQETDPPKAATFLRRAVKLPNNNLTVALQGLALCAEPAEMPDICRQLLALLPDRYDDLFGKLVKSAALLRQMAADVAPFVDILRKAADDSAGSEERRTSALFHLARLYVTNSGCHSTPDWQPAFFAALQHACCERRPASAELFAPANNTLTVHVIMYRTWLKMLYRRGAVEHRRLLEHAARAFDLYADESYALECICSVFVERHDDDDATEGGVGGFEALAEGLLSRPMQEYARTLVEISPRSTTGLMACALLAFDAEDFVQAKGWLIKLFGIQSDWDICRRLLVRTLLRLDAPAIGEALLRQQPVSDELLIECLVAQTECEEKAAEAVELCRHLLAAETDDVRRTRRLVFALARGLVTAGQHDLVDSTLAQLDSASLDAPHLATIVRATLHLRHNDAGAAIAVLTGDATTATSCEHLLLLGRAHLHAQQSALALGHLLAATKLQPYNSACFYWLARCYESQALTGRVRAIKCLEKCLLLNERHQAATELLVGLQLEPVAANGGGDGGSDAVATHERIERQLGAACADPVPGVRVACAWVWRLLGTARLRTGRHNDAVTAFRVALREQPSDVRCWMGLADTYRERGSLQSAMKVYEKCLEMKCGARAATGGGSADASMLSQHSALSATSTFTLPADADDEIVYAQLQIAVLKTATGAHAEAVREFGALLDGRPDFVPGLKGAADAHMGVAVECRERKLFGRAREHAAEAVRALTRALRQRNDFAVLWRLLATALTFVAQFAHDQAHLDVSAQLATNHPAAADNDDRDGDDEQTVRLASPALYALAAQCLGRALRLRPTDVLLWYDLALNHYERALTAADAADRSQQLDRATATARYAIQLQADRWQTWNLLGCCCAADARNLALAQHSFIRAVQLCRTAAAAWTNLGVLYAARAGDVRLANRAFAQAQQAQTDYAAGWCGQALLAERLGQPADAVDLFQHAVGLPEYSAEAAAGFVHWVCQALSAAERGEPVDAHARYVCERMHGATQALDAVEWYLRAEAAAADAAAAAAEPAVTASTWCQAGYLYARGGQWPQAERAFGRAVELIDADSEADADGGEQRRRDQMLFNRAVCLVRGGQAAEARLVFHAVRGASFETAVGLAVAHARDGEWEEAYGVYESALQLLAQTDGQRAQTLVAMAAIVFRFQGGEGAKALLFQCIGLPEPPVEGLFSGCALGIIERDMQLSELVLNELQQYKHDARYTHHIAFLTAQFHSQNNRARKALVHLLSEVHMHPDHVALRSVLAQHTMRTARRTDARQLTAASRVAESTIVLQLSGAKSLDSSEQGARSLALASEAMRCVNQRRRLVLAQRAVHVNPTSREAWAALLSCER